MSLCEYYQYHTNYETRDQLVNNGTEEESKLTKLQSRSKVAAEREPCNNRTHWKPRRKQFHYYGAFDLHYAIKLISGCNGTAFVESEDNFKMFINMIFPRRSSIQNLGITKSDDRFLGPIIRLHFKKRLNPLFDKIVERSTEQGIYKYWNTKFTYAKAVMNNIWGGDHYKVLQMYLNLSGIFKIYVWLAVTFVVVFLTEILLGNYKSFAYCLISLGGLVKSFKDLQSLEIVDITNTDNQFNIKYKL